jgi:cyclic pyranopterin monophosphate synthase
MTAQAGKEDNSGLSHLDAAGRPRMVDVTDKADTGREAVAKARVRMLPDTLKLIVSGNIPKGDVFTTARLAGIMAAKKTPELIPLCHPLLIGEVRVDFEVDESASTIDIITSAKTRGQTGVEMEALTAAAVSALTIYDMVKAVEKGVRLEEIRLVSKRGGKSGEVTLE